MGRQAPGFGGVTPPGPGARAGPRERIGLYASHFVDVFIILARLRFGMECTPPPP